MAKKKTEIRVEAEDAASSVFARIGENAEREMNAIGDTGRLAKGLTDQLALLIEQFGKGSEGSKQLAGQVRSLGESALSSAADVGTLVTSVTTLIALGGKIPAGLSKLLRFGSRFAPYAIPIEIAYEAGKFGRDVINESHPSMGTDVWAGGKNYLDERFKVDATPGTAWGLAANAIMERWRDVEWPALRDHLVPFDFDAANIDNATRSGQRGLDRDLEERERRVFNLTATAREREEAGFRARHRDDPNVTPEQLEKGAKRAGDLAAKEEEINKAYELRLQIADQLAARHKELVAEAEKFKTSGRDPQSVEQAKLVELAFLGAIDQFDFDWNSAEIQDRYDRKKKPKPKPEPFHGGRGAPLIESHYLYGKGHPDWDVGSQGGFGSGDNFQGAAGRAGQNQVDAIKGLATQLQKQHSEQLHALRDIARGQVGIGVQEMA